MTLEDLHRTVVDGFARVDARLSGHDRQFVSVDERFVRIDERFARVDERFARVDERFDRVDAEFVKVREEMHRLDARIREEAETTRRHFNVMVEKVEAAVRIVAEGHSHLQDIVDNHERRLQVIEKQS